MAFRRFSSWRFRSTVLDAVWVVEQHLVKPVTDQLLQILQDKVLFVCASELSAQQIKVNLTDIKLNGVQRLLPGVQKRFAQIKAGRLTQEDFYAWTEKAREKKAECDSGKITLEEFSEWLVDS